MHLLAPMLVQKMVETHSHFWKILAKELFETPNVLAAVSGILHPYLNVVLTPTIPLAERDAVLAALREFFASRAVPWLWQTRALPGDDFPQYLLSQHLRTVQTCPTMYFDLHQPLPKQKSTEIQVKAISHDKQFDDWIVPISQSFDCPGEITELFRRKYAEYPNEGITHFVGYFRNQPVASSSVYCRGGAAVLYNVSTNRDYRGRGFGAAITLNAMQCAKRQGAKYCLLDATRSGHRLYKHLRFQQFADLMLLQA